MRIDCEACGAAYAIDDNLIGDRGVRAQCPRCGAQKVVKKGAPAAAPAPAPAADPFAMTTGPGASPFGAPPPGPAADPFGAPAPAPSP
ncbi:MAG: zinc-ribbon domain-containing protein, partial [Myxococcota bacterium]